MLIFIKKYFIYFYLVMLIPVYFKTSGAFYVGYYQDDAKYINYARTIVQGDEYDIAFLNKGEKFKYMPGYSLVLSAIIKIFKYDIHLLRFFSILFTITGLLFFYRILSEIKKFPVELSVISVSIFSLSLTIFQFSGAVLSDPLFFCLVFFYLWYVSKTEQENNFGLKECIISGFILGYIFLTRPVGLSMIAATTVYFIYKNKIKPLFIILFSCFFIIILIFFILRKYITFWTFDIFFNFYNTKSVENITLFKHLYKSIRSYYLMVPFYFFSVSPNIYYYYITSSILTVIILLKSFKSKINLINIFIVFYIFIIFYWIDGEHRYLIPIAPFLIYGIISWLSEIFHKKNIYLISVVLLLFIGGRNYYFNSRINLKPPLETLEWVNKNIKNKDKITITSEGDKFFLLTNIKTIRFNLCPSFINTVIGIVNKDLQYIIHSYSSNVNRFPVNSGSMIRNQLKTPGTYKLLYNNQKEKTVVYEITLKKSTLSDIIDNYYIKAENFYKKKDYNNSIVLLKKAIALWEDFSFGYSVIGNCYFLMKDYKKMKEYFDKIIELNLYEPELLLQYAENLSLINDLEKLNKIKSHIENLINISDNPVLIDKFKKIYKSK